VMEEMAAAGSALLLMVVSPAINGTIISKFGTEEQKKRWIPSIADGTLTMAFAITEPDAGSNSHKITTTARRDGSDWILKGQKVYISGIDQAQAVLVVARTYKDTGAKSESLRPALFVVPRPGQAVETDALIAHCRTRLSAYKLPHTVRLIAEIPRTGSGKIIRYKLREALKELET